MFMLLQRRLDFLIRICPHHTVSCAKMKDDLDLSVRTPGGSLIWYQDRFGNLGGELPIDTIPDTSQNDWAEFILWGFAFPESGPYRICVTSFNQVGDADRYTVRGSTFEDVFFSANERNNGDGTESCFDTVFIPPECCR
jgi:hypothetical protein